MSAFAKDYPGGFIDGPNGGTPITAAVENNIEQGIADEDLRNPASPAALVEAGLYGHDVRAWAPFTVYAAGQAVVSPSGDVVTAKTAHTSGSTFSGTGSAGNWNLSATFTLLGTTELGSRFLFLGDSITAGSVTADQTFWGGGFAQQAAMQSGAQILMTRNAGVSGNKASDMLARFSTDVTPYAAQIDTVFLLAGTNDSAVTTFSTWITTMKSLITNIRALGKAPVMATIPPNNGAAPRPAAITQQNAWIRRYAQQQRIPLVDFYKVLVDPATGNYLSAYTADGTHPNTTGQVVMGTAVVNALGSLLAPSSVVIPQDSKDPNNLLLNGCFSTWGTPITPPTITIGTVSSGGTLAVGTYYYKVTVLNYQGESLPSNEVSVTITSGQEPQLTIPQVAGQRVLNIYRGATAGSEVLLAANVAPGNPAVWTDTGALTPGTATPPAQDFTTSPTSWGLNDAGPAQLVKLSDPAFQGFAARFLGTGTVRGMNQAIASSGKFSAGDTLAFVAKMRSDGTTPPNVVFKFTGTATVTYTVLGSGTTAWGPGVYYFEVVVPTGGTTLTVYCQQQSAVSGGQIDFGQMGVYNLTTLGVL